MLKKLALFCCLLTITSMYAQNNNAVKFNLFGIFGGNNMLEYERAINSNISAQLGVGVLNIISSSSSSFSSSETTTTGFLFIPEARYYFGESLQGLYSSLGFRLRLADREFDDTSVGNSIEFDYTETKTSIGGAVVIGYQQIIGSRILVDIFAGPQYKSISVSDREYSSIAATDDGFDSSFSSIKITEKGGFGVRFGLNVGIVF